MIKILVVGDFQPGSGLTNYLMNTYSEFNQEKFSIDCLSYSNSRSMEAEVRSKGWNYFSVTPITKNPVAHLLDWKRFLKKNGYKYDVAHFNYSASWNYFAIKIAKRYGVKKIITHSHNNYYSKQPKLKITKFLLDFLNQRGKIVIKKYSDLNFAVSKDAAKWMFDDNNVILQKNGINVDRFAFNQQDRDKLRANLGVDNNKVIGFVGTLEERKNPIFALRVFQRSLKEDETLKLLIFGDGPDRVMLVEECNRLGIQNNVQFMGIQSNLNQWYSAMDLFIFPSKNEGFGFVLLEAQVNGLPVICSNSIPKEAILTSSVKEASLAKTTVWMDIIREGLSVKDRLANSKINLKIITNAGYSIESTANELSNIIKKLVS